ncbi:MAG TPA: hypothetical protein VKF61_04490 [Candidatus Polarisedimenticolia bacterium]|nr:hypothetical protein [Candidatus Polarisedimenticolia bacterium]
MADSIRRADYFHVHVADKPGEGARILGALKDSGVNLLSLTAFPDGKGTTQIDFVTESAEALAKAVKGLGLKLSDKKRAFLVQGDDRAGAAAQIFKKLADAGVNVHSANACAGGKGAFGMILWVRPEHYDKAAKALGV